MQINLRSINYAFLSGGNSGMDDNIITVSRHHTVQYRMSEALRRINNNN